MIKEAIEDQSNKPTKITPVWIIGFLLSFFGFVGIMASDFIPGLALLLMGLILLPPVGKFIENKWKFKLTQTKKTLFVVLGFFIFIFSMGSSNPSENTTQKTVAETTPKAKEEATITPEIPTETIEPAPEKKLYSVLRVVDGDTVAVEIEGKEEVLRLIGINTPETVDPRKPVQCFGIEASNKAKETLNGKKVSIEADNTQNDLDKYNRPLRYIYLENGTNFNKMMIEEGYAFEYTYSSIPYKYQTDFKNAEKTAREQKKGLWAETACSGSLTKPTANSETSSSPVSTASIPEQKNTDSFSGNCAGKRTCGQMVNCEEAYFYLNSCGVSGLDRDKDGIPCETICN